MSPNVSSTPSRHSFWERWRRRIRYIYLKFIRLRGHPKELARGLAAGVFAGMFPLFGLQTIIGVAIALRIRGNPFMAAGGTWVSNPLTYLPIFAFNYQVGAWILGRSGAQPFTNLESIESWLETGADVTVTLMLGSFAMGLIFGLLSYLIGLPLIRRVNRRYRKLRHPEP
ncbi:MAG: DUF2062 domain-containing protein [Leptolyngbya sp. SIO1E4]|nr:DUF2062 domain-containing protein [Leptolyngbya sp. SIO1E4]